MFNSIITWYSTLKPLKIASTDTMKSPRVHGARGSAEILNIARSARTPANFKVSNALKLNFVSQICCSRNFSQFMIFHEISFFCTRKVDLGSATTFYTEFSGTSRVENLNPHGFNSVLANPQQFSAVGSRDTQENVPKLMRNFRFQNSEVLPPVEGVAGSNITFQEGCWGNPSLQAIFQLNPAIIKNVIKLM